MQTLKTLFVAAVALFGAATAVNASSTCRFDSSKNTPDNTDNNESSTSVEQHDLKVYGSNYTDGDKFEGLTRKVGFDRMIPPHALEVSYDKTTHIIFPSEIVYGEIHYP